MLDLMCTLHSIDSSWLVHFLSKSREMINRMISLVPRKNWGDESLEFVMNQVLTLSIAKSHTDIDIYIYVESAYGEEMPWWGGDEENSTSLLMYAFGYV
jgi:hypothetical protein